MVEFRVLDRRGSAGGGRAARRVDRLELRIRRQDVLRDVDDPFRSYSRSRPADDLDVDAHQALKHAVHSVVERRDFRLAFQDAELVAILENGLQVRTSQLAGLEVVGGREGRRPSQPGMLVVHKDNLHAGCHGLVEGRRNDLDRPG